MGAGANDEDERGCASQRIRPLRFAALFSMRDLCALADEKQAWAGASMAKSRDVGHRSRSKGCRPPQLKNPFASCLARRRESFHAPNESMQAAGLRREGDERSSRSRPHNAEREGGVASASDELSLASSVGRPDLSFKRKDGVNMSGGEELRKKEDGRKLTHESRTDEAQIASAG